MFFLLKIFPCFRVAAAEKGSTGEQNDQQLFPSNPSKVSRFWCRDKLSSLPPSSTSLFKKGFIFRALFRAAAVGEDAFTFTVQCKVQSTRFWQRVQLIMFVEICAQSTSLADWFDFRWAQVRIWRGVLLGARWRQDELVHFLLEFCFSQTLEFRSFLKSHFFIKKKYSCFSGFF